MTPPRSGREAPRPEGRDDDCPGGRDLFHRYCTVTYDIFMEGGDPDTDYDDIELQLQSRLQESTYEAESENAELDSALRTMAAHVSNLRSEHEVNLQVLEKSEEMRMQAEKL